MAFLFLAVRAMVDSRVIKFGGEHLIRRTDITELEVG